MAGGAVDDGRVGYVFAIICVYISFYGSRQRRNRGQELTNEDGPDVDQSEESNVRKLLERKEEWEYVVRNTLDPPVQWMERMACIWGWHDPFVMRLMERLVDHGMMQTPVDPIDAEICKSYEERELQIVIQIEGLVG